MEGGETATYASLSLCKVPLVYDDTGSGKPSIYILSDYCNDPPPKCKKFHNSHMTYHILQLLYHNKWHNS